MDLKFLEVLLPMLFQGLKLTFLIAVVGILTGTIIGSLCGYALQGNNKIAKVIAEVYIWIMRATPLMVQALYGYYVIPKLFRNRLAKYNRRYYGNCIKFWCIYIGNCERSIAWNRPRTKEKRECHLVLVMHKQ